MRSIFTCTIAALILTACSQTSITSTPLPEFTPTPRPAETNTPSPTPTETPTPESLLPQEVKEKFELAGVDFANMQNAKYDKDGLHITLESGEVIVLTNTDLQKGIYNGQDNVLQYRDEANQNVIYAFDPESKTFLEASKYIQKDKSDPEKYIQVKNWDELYALWAKEKMFLIPFDPNNTYFPESDEIFRDYLNSNNRQEGFYYPFGKLPAGMQSPFRLINFVIMQKDDLVGRLTDTYVISEQVYNTDDKSFSVIHFVRGDYERAQADIQEQIGAESGGGRFLLPSFQLGPKSLAHPGFNTLLVYYKNNGITVSSGLIPTVKNLVFEWFDKRHVPDELQHIPLNFRGASIN